MEGIVESYRKMAIEEHQNELNFDEEEAEEGDEVNEAHTFSVVAVVVTDRKVQLPGFHDLMSSIWRPGRGTKVMWDGSQMIPFNLGSKISTIPPKMDARVRCHILG
ncbi:unnamed protein product [Cuscuta epithymum]|uniref:Uncharacterized protein n=1 Tax=Cuscuta epithymum TaxID=186058 RepID=A0AAV0GEF2_9ASTE|nr:unnamed protein product [Cuscuta epithymum]